LENKVLIVTHVFPPQYGVGGRRWAKFSKCLIKQNQEVFVLTSESNDIKNSFWTDDVKQIKSKNIFYYKCRFPKILSKKNLSIIDKIWYKLSVLIIKVLTRGNYYDKTAFIEKKVVNAIFEILNKHKINTMIVSGGPFNLLYYGALVKERLPNLKFIADFRDPWTWGQNYGIKNLTKNKFLNEEIKQSFVINTADFITVPTEVMSDYLKSFYAKNEKIVVLPHGFDKADFEKKEFKITPSETIKLAYIGEEYQGIENYFEEIAKGLSEENAIFEIDFFVKTKRYQAIFESRGLLNKKVFYKDMLPANEIFRELKHYDFALLVIPDYGINYIGTKYYELIYAELPIVFIAKNGMASNFINNNQLGICLSENTIFDFFSNPKAAKDFKLKPFESIADFEMESVTKKLLKLIN